MISKDGFPYNNVWVKEESVISNNLQSMFLIVLRREDWSLLFMGKWSKKYVADSNSASALHLLYVSQYYSLANLIHFLCRHLWNNKVGSED